MCFTTVTGKETKTENWNLNTLRAVWRTRKHELKDYIVLLLESSMIFYFFPEVFLNTSHENKPNPDKWNVI